MTRNSIGVVVVTYQSAATIEKCLDMLLASVSVQRVIVVDNHSTDATLDLISQMMQKDTRIGLVKNKTNIGFAAACNQGASALSEAWLVFLNPDVYLAPDALSALRDTAVNHAGAGLLGVQLCDEKGVLDPAARRFDLSLLELFKHRGDANVLYMGRDDHQNVQSVEACSGALMMLPSTVFHQVDGFDSGFRLHVEDLDLSRRVRQAGYEVLVDNRITVTHVRGASSRARPIWVEWQKHRSIWRYFKKYEATEVSGLMHMLLWVCVWLHFAYSAARKLFTSRSG
jgi:N-acetylglucosaminyl-diphospho-decaprenol L-rhamnosyltransferase